MTDNGDLDHPIMDAADAPSDAAQDGALERDKTDGIIAQTGEDLAGRPEGDVLEVLRQRFREADVPVDDETLANAARRIASSQR